MSIYSGHNIFDDFRQRAVKSKFDQLRADLDTAAEVERDRLAKLNAQRQIETSRRMLLREHAAAGIEPIYSGAELISLTLARKLGHPGLHQGHGDMVPDHDVE